MPTYEYQCRDCGERLEVFQKFSDKPLRVHPSCGGQLKRIFHASGVVFKGSGYYATDSRSKSSTSRTNGANGSSDSTSEKSDTAQKSETTNNSASKSDDSSD